MEAALETDRADDGQTTTKISPTDSSEHEQKGVPFATVNREEGSSWSAQQSLARTDSIDSNISLNDCRSERAIYVSSPVKDVDDRLPARRNTEVSTTSGENKPHKPAPLEVGNHLPEGWTAQVSTTSGEIYYVNEITSEATFDFPDKEATLPSSTPGPASVSEAAVDTGENDGPNNADPGVCVLRSAASRVHMCTITPRLWRVVIMHRTAC